MRQIACFLPLALATLFACGDSESSTPTQDASVPDSGVAEDAGPTGECASAPVQTFVANAGTNAQGFGATLNALYTLDTERGNELAGLQRSGAIMSVPKTGGTLADFYVPTDATHRIASFLTSDNDVYVLEYNPNDAATSGRLMRIPAAGGTATQVSDAALNAGASSLADADADSVYVVTPTSVSNFVVVRIMKASGAYTTIAEVMSGVPGNAHVFGSDFYFSFAQGTGPLYKAPISNTTPSQTKVTDRACPGGIQFTSGGALCGDALSLLKFDNAFTTSTSVYEVAASPSDTEGSLPRPRGVDGDRVYFSLSVPESKRVSLRQLPLSGGPSAAVACNVGNVKAVKWDALRVYWLESRAEGDAEASVSEIYSQPRR